MRDGENHAERGVENMVRAHRYAGTTRVRDHVKALGGNHTKQRRAG